MARRQRSTVAGRIDVTSMLLRDQRVTVRIYLPADYEWSDRDHRVVYMFDAHNLFDRTTSTYNKEWRVDEFMEGLSAAGVYEPAIVVGIDAPQNRYDRFAMYSIGEWEYRRRPDTRRLHRIHGFGDETAAFLMRTVKRYVEKTYRASRDQERIAVAGSSMGGYMALYVGARFQQQVSKVMAFSPVLMDFPMRGYVLRDEIVRAGFRSRSASTRTWGIGRCSTSAARANSRIISRRSGSPSNRPDTVRCAPVWRPGTATMSVPGRAASPVPICGLSTVWRPTESACRRSTYPEM